MIGIGVALILTCIEIGAFWLVSLHAPAGQDLPHLLAAVVALVRAVPFWLLLPFVEIVGTILVIALAARPLALRAYVRDAQQALQQYRASYTSLTSFSDIYETTVAYYQNITAPNTPVQRQDISLLDMTRLRAGSLCILGAPGTGKTLALLAQQAGALRGYAAVVRGQGRLPIYVPLERYSLYLTRRKSIDFVASGEAGVTSQDSDDGASGAHLLDFLYDCDVPAIQHLRPYLYKLVMRGQLLFLCDDLHLVDPGYRSAVVAELLALTRETANQVVVTCCDLGNEAFPQLEQLVEDGAMACAMLLPLQSEQMRTFVESAMSTPGSQGSQQYTAGQIMQVIERGRLHYLCSNPLMLCVLIAVIDRVDAGHIYELDNRGLLLRAFVEQLIEQAQDQRRWRKEVPSEGEVLHFLGRLATGMYWASASNTIQLPATENIITRSVAGHMLAGPLDTWLQQHPAPGPFALDENLDAAPSYDHAALALLLEFVQEAGLLECSPDGALSFRHAWIAAYLVAESFSTAGADLETQAPLHEGLLADVVHWSAPVVIWAGLLDDPLVLAGRFAALAGEFPAYSVQALALSLLCLGVAWTPPRYTASPPVALPTSVEELFTTVVRDARTRGELVLLLTHCIEEGIQEVYQALLPLVMVAGAEELLLHFERANVPDLLFDYLAEAIDNAAYDSQVKRLIPVLGRFGEAAVPLAAELSEPAPGRSVRMRAAAIRILARTGTRSAIAPLMLCLSDGERPIVEAAMTALIRFGPHLTLDDLSEALAPATSASGQMHQAALAILEYFLNEQDPARCLTDGERQRVLTAIYPLLSSHYAAGMQRQAREVLVGQIQEQPPTLAGEVLDLLMRGLFSGDEMLVRNVVQVLQQAGTAATAFLLAQLDGQSSEVARMHIVEVLGTVRDPQALPHLLEQVADSSQMVQQQLALALHAYLPASIPGLIDLVLSSPNEPVATRAAQLLCEMDEEVVAPIIEILPHLVSGRTHLLVHVLDQVHDPRALPALIDLLQNPRAEPLLMVSIIETLSQFAAPQVVPPLIDATANSSPLIYEEAITALSQLGEVALPDLLVALDIDPTRESVLTQRARRSVLGMDPFPGELLLDALLQGSDLLAMQIMTIFRERGADAALLLVNYLFHPDLRLRDYVRQAFNDMPGQSVVPALLEVLHQASWRQLIAEYLLKHPDEAIPPLVSLLADPQRGEAAVAILHLFGPVILPALVPALDAQDEIARSLARQMIVMQVRTQPQILPEVVRLFGPSLPQRAHESLVEVLTSDLADISIPTLLAGLDDAYLLTGVSESLVRLVRQRRTPQSDAALKGLLDALRDEQRRHGAEITLTELSGQAVARVGDLITDPDPQVALAAQRVLRDIGTPAFSFIWAACSDISNRPRRDAAMEIFSSMPTVVIKDELVAYLASDNLQDSTMATTLLRERIHDEEASQQHSQQEMAPALLEYVYTHEGEEHTTLRIIALLLLIGGHDVVNHTVQALYDHPDYPNQLVQAFLFLGQEGEKALWTTFNDPLTPPELRARVVSVLGLIAPSPDIRDLATSLSQYGLSLDQANITNVERLEIALRALGGLLAGGHWNPTHLQELRRTSPQGSRERELYNVLLGWRYGAHITRLENDLQTERTLRREDIQNYTMQILEAQSHARDAEQETQEARGELEQVRQEFLHLQQDLALARRELDQSRQTHGVRAQELERELEQATRQTQRLQGIISQTVQEKKLVQDQVAQLQAYNAQLTQQISLLQGQGSHSP
ncbi:MAG: HEAT repeat domain-containing protein [Ktedonobacteraceae bacterium]